MIKLKTNTPVASTESIEELTNAAMTNANQHYGLSQIVTICNNTPVLSLESAALMELSASIMGCGEVTDDLGQHLGKSGTAATESFTSKVKELGSKILEQIKRIWKWIAEKLTGTGKKVETLLIGVKDMESKYLDHKSMSVKLQPEPKGIEQLVEKAQSKSPDKPIKKSDNIYYDSETGKYHIASRRANMFLDDSIHKMRDFLMSLDSPNITEKTNTSDVSRIINDLIRRLSLFSKSGPRNGEMILDHLATPKLVTAILPVMVDGVFTTPKLVSSDSAISSEVDLSTGFMGKPRLQLLRDLLDIMNNVIDKLNTELEKRTGTVSLIEDSVDARNVLTLVTFERLSTVGIFERLMSIVTAHTSDVEFILANESKK